jgi:multiple sugar transport system ATP-binding protein
VTLGIRPDRLEIADQGQLSGTVRLAERLGTENHLHIELAMGGQVVVITDGTHPARARDKVQLCIPPADAHVFDATGQALPRKLDAATEALITEPEGPAEPARP